MNRLGYLSQADWFYGIKKPPPAFDKCPPNTIKEDTGSGFRCIEQFAPPTPAAPTTPTSLPVAPGLTTPLLDLDEGGILDNKYLPYIAGGGFLVLTLLLILLRR